MTQIMELMDKRAKAWEAAKAFLNSHSQNGGMVSAEDAATYDKMEKEVTDLTKDIERLQRQEQIDQLPVPAALGRRGRYRPCQRGGIQLHIHRVSSSSSSGVTDHSTPWPGRSSTAMVISPPLRFLSRSRYCRHAVSGKSNRRGRS